MQTTFKAKAHCTILDKELNKEHFFYAQNLAKKKKKKKHLVRISTAGGNTLRDQRRVARLV